MSKIQQSAIEQAQKGENARTMLAKAIVEFQAACLMQDWHESEEVRHNAHDALDAYFDSVATLHRMIPGR